MSVEHQLLLPILGRNQLSREDFLVNKTNEAAFNYIDLWPLWASGAALLIGTKGSGKTHLANIFANKSNARTERADALTNETLSEFGNVPVLVLEDCDLFPAQETAMFHLLNRIKETEHFLLLTAREQPFPKDDKVGENGWYIATPDLLSRLRALPFLKINDPDDDLLHSLLVKYFDDRQIRVDANVISYALQRLERSHAALASFVESLDKHSLVHKKPITRALVSAILDQ